LKAGGKEVVSHVHYEYMGPSPNPLPASVGATADSSNSDSKPTTAAAAPAPAVAGKVDFSGVWQRTKTHNFEAFIGATGAGFMQRKLAAQMALTHTITMDPPGLQAFRLQEKGGPINLDNTLTIGADFEPTNLSGRKFLQRMYWMDNMLVLQRRAEDGSYEMVLSRTLDTETSIDNPQIILKSVHRDLASGREIEATSWFSKTGPSPNPPPVPNLSLLANAPTPEPTKPAEEEVPADYQDNEEDDDDIAVAKMRTVSVAQKSYIQRTMTSMGESSKIKPSESLLASLKKAGDAAFVDFSGEWAQNSSSRSMMNWMYHRARTRYTIKMTKESLHLVEIDHKTLIEDAKFDIGSEEFTTVMNKKRKAIKARCYWEGSVLVLHKVYPKSKYELFIRRELEDNGQTMRQVTVRKDVSSGSQSEFMAVFKRVK
jgi:hypothetical protein